MRQGGYEALSFSTVPATRAHNRFIPRMEDSTLEW